MVISLQNIENKEGSGGGLETGCVGVESSHGEKGIGVCTHSGASEGDQSFVRVEGVCVEERRMSCLQGDVIEGPKDKGDGSVLDFGQDLSKPLCSFLMGCASSTKPNKIKKVRRVSRKVDDGVQVEKIGPRGEKRKECDGNELAQTNNVECMGKRVCREPVLEENDDMDESYGSLTVAEVGHIQPREEQ